MARPASIEKEALIKQCRELSQKLGRAPYEWEFDTNTGTHCYKSVTNYFESWNAFLIACGLTVNRVTGTSKSQIRQYIMNLANELKRAPTRAEYAKYAKENGLCSAMVIQRYWGSWTNCLIDCGFMPSKSKKQRPYGHKDYFEI